MATSFIKSFMEVVNPAAGKAAKRAWDPQDRQTERRMHPESAPNALMELTTKEALEEWSTGLEIVVVPQTVQEPAADEENILEISGELAERMKLADQIVVRRWIPVEEFEEEEDADSKPVPTSVEDSGSEEGNIIRDAKFFQDAVTELQKAYQSLDEKYTHPSILVKEASEALKASESHVTKLQGELKALLQNRNKDIQVAVSQTVVDYEQKLSKEQSHIQTLSWLLTCRDKFRRSRFLWVAKGICLQWVQLRKVWTWGTRFSTTSQAP